MVPMTDGLRTNAMKKQATAAFLGVVMILFLASTSTAAGPAVPPEPMPEAPGTNLSQCQELIAILAEQDQKNSREFRQIKRDIAALAQEVAEPGMREIFGGVGYILGLFGVAAYVASRKNVGGGGR